LAVWVIEGQTLNNAATVNDFLAGTS